MMKMLMMINHDANDVEDEDDHNDCHQLVRGNAAQMDHYQRTLPAVLESLQVLARISIVSFSSSLF